MVYLLPNPCCREENNCPEIVEPVYLGIVNVDTDYGSTEHSPALPVTPYITISHLFFSKKRILIYRVKSVNH